MGNFETENNNIAKLSYELTYHNYIMNRDNARLLFKELSVSEYLLLHYLIKFTSESDAPKEKVYLMDLAENLKQPMREISKLAGSLKERGLIIWAHDGNGSEGTYLIITESGLKLVYRQDEIMKDYYGRVIQKYGKENVIALLKMMSDLEEVIDSVFAEKGEEVYGN